MKALKLSVTSVITMRITHFVSTIQMDCFAPLFQKRSPARRKRISAFLFVSFFFALIPSKKKRLKGLGVKGWFIFEMDRRGRRSLR